MVEQSPPSPSVQSARRLQFSLRSLLVAISAAALLFALVAYHGFFGGLVFFLASNLTLAAYLARRGKKGRALGISVFAVFLFAMIAPAGPPTHYRAAHSFICTNCGLERWTYEEGRIGSESGRTTSEQFHETDVSNWCQQHFGKCTQHKWKEGSDGSTNYTSFLGLRWATSAQSWCCVGTDVELDDEERKRLDELFIKDKKACRQEIVKRLP